MVRARQWLIDRRTSIQSIVRRRALVFEARRGSLTRSGATQGAATLDALLGEIQHGGYIALQVWRGLLMRVLHLIAGIALSDYDRRNRLFDAGEQVGVHILPVHFYSPVPVLRELSEETWRAYDLAGVDWRTDEQRALVRRLARWGPELIELASRPPGDTRTFAFDNPAFNSTDAAIYYSLIRECQPRQILEVGAGHSTLLSTHAAALNGTTVVDCIEPFPMQVLREKPNGLRRLIEQPVQTVPLDEFTRLEGGDILFIDCSHVARIGSDVNYLLLRVLPHLQDGVMVHVHDIFLPEEYPRQWVTEQKLFWSEQYVLHAFLMFNTTFRVLCSSHYLGNWFPDDIVSAFPFCVPPGGASLWFQRRATPA
ncbi:MAG: class I SAM-dependent methyltransferase [Chloroflexi bacterium]|nr:class I SAM-dependent methyltransferase [Chloroflexota bacterium]